MAWQKAYLRESHRNLINGVLYDEENEKRRQYCIPHEGEESTITCGQTKPIRSFFVFLIYGNRYHCANLHLIIFAFVCFMDDVSRAFAIPVQIAVYKPSAPLSPHRQTTMTATMMQTITLECTCASQQRFFLFFFPSTQTEKTFRNPIVHPYSATWSFHSCVSLVSTCSDSVAACFHILVNLVRAHTFSWSFVFVSVLRYRFVVCIVGCCM